MCRHAALPSVEVAGTAGTSTHFRGLIHMTRTVIRRSASACGAVALGALLLAAPASASPDGGFIDVGHTSKTTSTPGAGDELELSQFGLGALAGAGLVTAGALARAQTRRRNLRMV
jgi:hypothetical protein